MPQRRYGPTLAAGTVIIEKQSEAAIQPAALGVTAYTGIMKKGPVGKAFRAKNRTQFLFKAGGSSAFATVGDMTKNATIMMMLNKYFLIVVLCLSIVMIR